MAPPQKISKPAGVQTKAKELQPGSAVGLPASNSSSSANVGFASTNKPLSQGQPHEDVTTIAEKMGKLNVTAETTAHPLPDGPGADNTLVASIAEDDRSHLSNSSTKPPSFDTKSMASENTFAMEEKESLRPDDSASVQAADEDEPFFVPLVSGRPEAHLALESGNSVTRRPLQDGAVPLGHPGRRFPMTTMANPPRFGEIVPSVSPCFPQTVANSNTFPANQSGGEPPPQYAPGSMLPDEKLIEAMGTPKDRLLLLQLEEKFLAFVAQSKYVASTAVLPTPIARLRYGVPVGVTYLRP
jgi:hypothetical protein